MNAQRRFGRAVAANIALLVLVVGVPVALVVAVGSPLPRSLPNWSQLSTALTRGDVAEHTLLKVVASAVWLAWLQITVTALNEIAATIRGVTSRPLPFSSTSLQLGVGRLVATAALLFSSLHQPPTRPTASLPRPLLAAAVAELVQTTDVNTASVETSPPLATREWVVAPRETLWGIAERVLGDGRAYTQLLALNHGRPQPDGTPFTDPHHLQSGTRLLLPPTPGPPATAAAHHVTPGDSLSTIARDELHDPSRWPELFDLNRGNPQPDGGRLTDPNLLQPGWTLQLPAVAAGSPAPQPAVESPASPTPLLPPTPTTLSPEDNTRPETRHPTDAEPTEDHEDAPSLAEEIGWTGGAVLSGGLLLLAERLRRRRRRALSTLRRPGRTIRDIDLALRATSTGDEHLARATRTLRQLSLDLRHQTVDQSTPEIIELGPDHIEVLWTQPLFPTVGSWTTTDGGWSWTHPTADPPLDPAAAAPCPALVTIGSRDSNPVLANLEALGTLAIRGHSAPDLVRALVLELSTTPFADVLTVITCGLPDQHHQLDRITAMSLDDAVAWARDRTAADQDAPSGASFARRVTARTEPREPVVVVCGDVDVEDPAYVELLDLSLPGSGVVVVLIEPPQRAGEWCLRSQGATVTLEPIGLVLTAHPLTPQGVDAVTELLDDIGDTDSEDTGDDQPGEIVPAAISAAWHDPTEAPRTALGGEGESRDDEFTDAPCDLELRLFGQVDVGGTTTKLTPGETELLAYLHCHPEGQTADLIRTALWPDGRSPKTLHNRMSGLRNKLGLGADGQPLLPHGTDDRYRLSSRVTSDWRRALARIHHAETVPSIAAVAVLREALELVTGPPFVATTGYSWAYSEGLATEMIEVVKHAARHLAELALDAGDPTGAIWAARRGQRVTSPADSQQLTLVAMKAHAELGNPAAAVAAYRELLTDLDELDPDLEPARDVLAAYEDIRRARAS